MPSILILFIWSKPQKSHLYAGRLHLQFPWFRDTEPCGMEGDFCRESNMLQGIFLSPLKRRILILIQTQLSYILCTICVPTLHSGPWFTGSPVEQICYFIPNPHQCPRWPTFNSAPPVKSLGSSQRIQHQYQYQTKAKTNNHPRSTAAISGTASLYNVRPASLKIYCPEQDYSGAYFYQHSRSRRARRFPKATCRGPRAARTRGTRGCASRCANDRIDTR